MPGDFSSSGGDRYGGRRQGGNIKVSIKPLPSLPRLPCSLILTPLDDEQSPGIFYLEEDFE